MYKNKGFTLIELILVISLGITITFMTFQSMIKEQENKTAEIAGQQIKQIGTAVNTYITNHYDTISRLNNATGINIDFGPRTCVTTTNTCLINVSTLSNEGLLPSSYSQQNIYGSDYTIIIKREGEGPYYNISSLITTNNSWKTANNIRYDLLGKAMQSAGIDSGMSRNIINKIDGYKGLWSYTSSDFPNINKLGQLAYIAGYESNSYAVFLRRDGTLPMTGSLNMGINDIINAKNITGSGDLNMGANIIANGKGIFGSEISAKNSYGDVITLGGDSMNNDYEIKLNSNKPLSIYSPNANNTDTTFQVINGNAKFNNKIATNGLNPEDIPNGWGGGIRTWDVLSGGTVAILKEGKKGSDINNNIGLAAYINNTGNIYASGNVNVDGNITTGSTVNVGGRLIANEVIKLNNNSLINANCDTGSISRDSSGAAMNCINGKWTYMRSFQNLTTSGPVFDSICVGAGDTNPPNYAYPQWAMTCGSRYCSSQGFTTGFVTESPGVPANKPFGSNATSIKVSCSR